MKVELHHIVAVALGLVAVFYSYFFLEGLALFDNDYNQWLTYANSQSIWTSLWDVFNPLLTDWNVDYRPTQTLIFEGLYAFFGYQAYGYYLFKALMLGAFCVVYFLTLRRFLNSSLLAFLSAFLLATACSTFTSLYWVSDFVIVSEFLALLVFVVFLHLENQDRPSPGKVFLCLALMVVITLVCDRTKANGKLIPAILFFYLVLFDWRKLKRYFLAIAVMVAMLIPWPVFLENPAPFIVANKAPASHAWQPASLKKFWLLFGQDFEPWSLFYSSYPPISILAILGFPLIYLGGASLLAILVRREQPCPKAVKLLVVWSAVNIAALLSYPKLPVYFQSRYAISVLIPLLPLLLYCMLAVGRQSVRLRWPSVVIVSLLILVQVGFHTYHTFRMRDTGMPALMIAADSIRGHIADQYQNAGFYFYNLPAFFYRPTDKENLLISSRGDKFEDFLTYLPPGSPAFVVSNGPLYSPVLYKKASFPGRSQSFFDLLFYPPSKEPPVTLYLYQYRSN